jgi:glycosyltransferase involved in cell wall biosynthesis
LVVGSDFDKSRMTRPARIAVLLKSFQLGGAQRNLITLANAFSARGYPVDFLIAQNTGPLQADLSPGVRILELERTPRAVLPLLLIPRILSSPAEIVELLRRGAPSVVTRVPALSRYLVRERPDAVLTTLPFNNLAAIWASVLARTNTPIVIRMAGTLWARAPADRPFAGLVAFECRRWYRRAKAVVAISDGVADDLRDALGVPPEIIATISNPVDLAKVADLANHPAEHPWFEDAEAPVVLAVGRMVPQKDFGTLLKAFAIVRSQRRARLAILGEGRERPAIEALARSLGIDGDVWMPGAVVNPYPYMARAATLVLSSAWEGFPNVLIEALACGCPVVSTDCRNGPAEVLAQGRYGRLVPVGDAQGMASAILETVAAPRHADHQRRRAADFALPTVVDRYLDLLLGSRAPAGSGDLPPHSATAELPTAPPASGALAPKREQPAGTAMRTGA